MSHKIYGQQVLFIEEDNPIVASTPEEMVALLTSDNVGKFVKYIGETRDFEFSTPTGRNIPVNPVTVDNSVEKWYFDTSVAPDFTQFAWSDLSSSETESIMLCTVAVPGTTSGDKYILKVERFPKGSRFASSWPQLKEDAYTIRIPYTSPAFRGYAYISTEELANQIRHTGANPPQVHQGWMVKQGTWNKDDYGWWVTNVSQQDVWGGYISKDGKWVAEVINTNLSLVKDAFYKISEETDIVRYYELPALTNEGAAADLAEGKELINSNGEKVVGIASGGGDYTVKVIDYDGTVLLEKKGNTGDVISLPTAPTHDKLVFQEWSASVAVSDNKVTIADNDIIVGAVYTTVSGQNEFDVTLTKVTGLSVTLNMDGTKDWGDGTSDTATSHTYTAYGDYTIKCDGTTMTTSYESGGLFGQKSSTRNYYCTVARFATVTRIGDYAFSYCYSLTSVVIPSGVTVMGDSVFYYCYSLISIVIPSRVMTIGNSAFCECESLTSIVIPRRMTIIYASAFSYCYSLTSIVLPNSVESIYSNAFNHCHSLPSIAIPSKITGISQGTFSYCYSLTRIVIPNSVTSIGVGAFSYCYSLTSVVIPSRVLSIGQEAFRFCYALTSIVIPSGVNVIDTDAFRECASLTSIDIPSRVTKIYSQAFYGCVSLTKYDFSQHTSVPTLSTTTAFTAINKICKIIVPDSLYDSWIAASNWSTYANYIYKASEVAE